MNLNDLADFIASLPAGRLSTKDRKSRLSFIPTKHNTPQGTYSVEKNVQGSTTKSGRPFMDISNHHQTNQSTTKTRRSISRRSSTFNKPSFRNETRVGATPSELYNRRTRNKTPNSSLSSRGQAGQTNGEVKSLMPISSSNIPLDPTRLRDPNISLALRKIMDNRQSLIPTKVTKTPLSMKRITSLSARKSVTKMWSSQEKTGPFNNYDLRSGNNQPINATEVNQEEDQDCRRELKFHISFDERDEDVKFTTPLPPVDLTSTKATGSMLHGYKGSLKNENSFSLEKEVCLKLNEAKREDAFLVSRSKSFQDNSQRRRSALPQLKKTHSLEEDTCSDLPKGFMDIIKNRKGKLLARRSMSAIISSAETRNVSIPELRVTLQSHSEDTKDIPETKSSPSQVTQVASSLSKGLRLSKATPLPMHTSPGPPPNSPADFSGTYTLKKDLAPPSTTADPKCSWKDSLCNSIPSAIFQFPLVEVEQRIEKVLCEQKRIRDAFRDLFQEVTDTTENLLAEYRSSFEPIRKLQEEFESKIKIESTSEENKEDDREKEEKNRDKNVVDTKETKPQTTFTNYNFLNHPIKKKSKNSKQLLRRTFSHPPPSNTVNTSPSNLEESFHSVDSSVSPFTDMVGNCQRPSLVPMTPRMRLHFTQMKHNLNDQLQMLFDN